MFRSERSLIEAPVVPLKGAASANPERFSVSLLEDSGRDVIFGGGPGGGPGSVVGGGTAFGTADGTAPVAELEEKGSRHSVRVASAGTRRGPRGEAKLAAGSASISMASGLFGLGSVIRVAGVELAGGGTLFFGTSDSSVSSLTVVAAACFLGFLRSASAMEVRRLGTVPFEGDVLPSLGCGNAHFGSANCFFHSSEENFTDPLRDSSVDGGTVSFFGGEPGGGGGTLKGLVVPSLVFGRAANESVVGAMKGSVVGALKGVAVAPFVFGPGVPFFARGSSLMSLGSNGFRSVLEVEGRGIQWLEDGAGECSVRLLDSLWPCEWVRELPWNCPFHSPEKN